MSAEVITKEDLQAFRVELLSDIKALLGTKVEPAKEWLKTSEVRTLLKVSSGTLQNLRTSGQLKYSKIGGTYYYRHSEIIKLLQSQAKSL